MKSEKREEKARRGELRRHKASVLGICIVILLLCGVITVGSISLRQKKQSYIVQETELTEQIEREKERSEELSELEEFVGTDEYIEQTAKDKLGLVHEGEIIFKRR